MTTSTSSTLVNLTHTQMLPSKPQGGKRKPDDFNPLLNFAAAKRAKKDAKAGSSSKRKLNNDDETGGLIIVRAPESQPAHSQPEPAHTTVPQPRFASQALPDVAGPSKPASKKFRADSQPPRATSKPPSTSQGRVASAGQRDTQAEDEADRLRRMSRANTTINTSLLAGDLGTHLAPWTDDLATTSRSKGKAKATEMTPGMVERENAQLERNRLMRQGSGDVPAEGRGRAMDASANRGHQRRKSSVGARGKRMSMAFETTGIITQPHNSVSESSFFKHIDCDLPDSERIRQLLIWCSLRAAAAPPALSSSKTPLPPLSNDGALALKSLQEDLVRMLAEKRIDLLPKAGSSKHPPEDLRENEQNVRNRQLEVTYSQHVQQAQTEEESWKKVSYGYDAYFKKLQASLEKRTADLDPQALSAKAKGKRRATGDLDDIESHFMPHEHELPSDFHSALALAKSVLGYRAVGDERVPGRRSMSRLNLTREELEAEIKQRLPSFEFRIDQIFSYASAARAVTDIAERALNARFDILSSNLASRLHPSVRAHDAGAPESATELLTTYVAHVASRKAGAADPRELLRALSRVDQERPPAQVGDAARRAAREVQRANENGVSAVGDRRLTGVPATPRKTPGTPRRGTTPSRDR